MKINKSKVTTAVLLAATFGAGAASADIFGSIVKIGGAVLVADKFGPQIDSVLRKVTGQKNFAQQGIATKVVPVISLGSRKAVGIVQISGSPQGIDQTKAVAQLSANLPIVNNVQGRVLIPVDTRTVTNMKRVPGVGVSAVIDLKF